MQKEREYSSELESTVKERTKELHVALETENILKKELHHRVKNNMQFIISLFKLRLYPFMSDDINRVIKEVTYKIKGMARAHDMLYSQKSLNTIDTNEYFTQLINELKNGYETEHIRFDIKVETELYSDRLIYCGLIVNEVIINALKYAFDDGQNGVINLNLYKNKDETILELSDNGVGLKENHKQSFGLLMVNTLVTEQLKGTIEFDTKSGTAIKIKI